MLPPEDLVQGHIWPPNLDCLQLCIWLSSASPVSGSLCGSVPNVLQSGAKYLTWGCGGMRSFVHYVCNSVFFVVVFLNCTTGGAKVGHF